MNYMILLLVLCLAPLSEACSPAQRASIDKLRKYFGMEPFYPNADLATTGFSDEFIGAADDLNCNFNTPEAESQGADPKPSHVAAICKWKNIANTTVHELDDEDWFLFTKSDNKKNWNILRPRRTGGTQTPSPGDGFALSGGERRKAKEGQPQAILYSSPIKCLENDAKLEFDYWLFSVASVDVALLEKDTLKVLWRQDAKSACNRVSPKSGRCSVTIAKQDSPFHLAIHSHNLATAFVIIDNIAFVGDLGPKCAYREDPFDFGGSTQIINGRHSASAIKTASDLDTDGGTGAYWSNSGNGGVNFVRHTGPLAAAKWKAATGESTVPAGSFFYARGIDGQAQLMSDMIHCQNKDGELTFKAWMSEMTTLKVCVVDADNVDDKIYACTTVDPPMSGGKYTMPIYGPLDNARIMFVASDWDAGNGGFVAIDDIKYRSVLCSEEPVVTTTVAPVDPDKVACNALSTDFDEQSITTTNWKQYGTPTPPADYEGFTLIGHQIDKQLVTAQNTRISCSDTTGKCAGTLLDKTVELQIGIMQSEIFKLAQDRFLGMHIRRGTYGSMMHVCVNTPPQIDGTGKVVESSSCKRIAGPDLTYTEYRNGKDTGILLPKTATQVFIVMTNPVDAGAEKAAFLVDNIKLHQGSQMSSGPLCEGQKR